MRKMLTQCFMLCALLMVCVTTSNLWYLFNVLLPWILPAPLPCCKKRCLILLELGIFVKLHLLIQVNSTVLRLSSYVPLPPKLEKSLSVAADDRRVPDNPKAPQQDKMATLRAYRCAQGLCVKCAQKWSRDHKCPAIVQLHVLEELLDACPIEESTV